MDICSSRGNCPHTETDNPLLTPQATTFKYCTHFIDIVITNSKAHMAMYQEKVLLNNFKHYNSLVRMQWLFYFKIVTAIVNI